MSAVVELRSPRGRRHGAAVVVLRRGRDGSSGKPEFSLIGGPAIGFPNACTAATARAIRTFICPNPWAVLRYPRPRIHAETSLTQPIRSADLHAIDWRKVALPGAVCGSSSSIYPRDYGYGPTSFIHADVDLIWWNPVWVYSWTRPVFGDLESDGRDEAALQVVCANGGGTAGGQLAFSEVIFKVVGKTLRVIGIVTPRQPPFDPNATHVPLSSVTAIRHKRVVVSEAWYGKYDGTAGGSGQARTVWTYANGTFHPRTTIVRKPWSSAINIYDFLVDPCYCDDFQKIPLHPNLRFEVMLRNEGNVTKPHVAVTFTAAQASATTTETKTAQEVKPFAVNPPTLIFGNLSRLKPGKATLTIAIHEPGAFPLRYPVVFTNG